LPAAVCPTAVGKEARDVLDVKRPPSDCVVVVEGWSDARRSHFTSRLVQRLIDTAVRSAYAAINAAMLGSAHAIARDLGVFNIPVNCFDPEPSATRWNHAKFRWTLLEQCLRDADGHFPAEPLDHRTSAFPESQSRR